MNATGSATTSRWQKVRGMVIEIENGDLLAASKKIVICDVCQKTINSERFRVVLVYSTNRIDYFFHKAMSGPEKELTVCDDCALNLNFRPWSDGSEKKVV